MAVVFMTPWSLIHLAFSTPQLSSRILTRLSDLLHRNPPSPAHTFTPFRLQSLISFWQLFPRSTLRLPSRNVQTMKYLFSECLLKWSLCHSKPKPLQDYWCVSSYLDGNWGPCFACEQFGKVSLLLDSLYHSALIREERGGVVDVCLPGGGPAFRLALLFVTHSGWVVKL